MDPGAALATSATPTAEAQHNVLGMRLYSWKSSLELIGAIGPEVAGGAPVPDKIHKIDHVGIAVADLEAAIRVYSLLWGAPPVSIEEVPDQKVRTAFFRAGDSCIELLCPTATDSPIAGFLAKRGGGIHHICLVVADLEHALSDLAAAGLTLVDARPRLGAHGKRVAFVHPKAFGGVLLELCETPRSGCTPTPHLPHSGAAEGG